jgi:hypothetical protein
MSCSVLRRYVCAAAWAPSALPAQMAVMTGVSQAAVAAGSSKACWKASRTSR